MDFLVERGTRVPAELTEGSGKFLFTSDTGDPHLTPLSRALRWKLILLIEFRITTSCIGSHVSDPRFQPRALLTGAFVGRVGARDTFISLLSVTWCSCGYGPDLRRNASARRI